MRTVELRFSLPINTRLLGAIVYALIAQSVEHAAVNRRVTGSSPVWGAKERTTTKVVVFSFTS